jgi:hypothetical protein
MLNDQRHVLYTRGSVPTTLQIRNWFSRQDT